MTFIWPFPCTEVCVQCCDNFGVTPAGVPGFRFNVRLLGAVRHQKCWNRRFIVCCKVFLGRFLCLFIFLFLALAYTHTHRVTHKDPHTKIASGRIYIRTQHVKSTCCYISVCIKWLSFVLRQILALWLTTTARPFGLVLPLHKYTFLDQKYH